MEAVEEGEVGGEEEEEDEEEEEEDESEESEESEERRFVKKAIAILGLLSTNRGSLEGDIPHLFTKLG